MKTFFTLSLLFVTSPVVAEAATAAPSPGLAFAKVILVLGFIIGLILASAWFARRSGLASFVNNENFKVVASLPLGQKEKAVLIRVGKQHMLLGVAPGSVTRLHTYAENDNPLEHASTEAASSRTKTGVDFATQIKKLLSQGQTK